VLRRLLVVGLVWGCLCAPASARAATVAVFYYPWYSTPALDGAWQHWSQNGHRPPVDLYSRYFPLGGAYSSSDAAVLDRQMAQIAGAGVDEVISSWWGRGSVEDARLPSVVAAAARRRLTVGIHLEPYAGRTAATVADDLAYIAGLGIHDVFVYHPRDFTTADWTTLHAAQPRLRLFAGTESAGFASAGHFDGFYTYDFVTYTGDKFARFCSQAHTMRLLCAPSVGPGYDGRRAGEAPVGRERANGQTYDTLWNAVLQAKPDLVTITSYNEWARARRSSPRRGGPATAPTTEPGA
jgi:glycoprotein endo-alpha-1,2-mannosidase